MRRSVAAVAARLTSSSAVPSLQLSALRTAAQCSSRRVGAAVVSASSAGRSSSWSLSARWLSSAASAPAASVESRLSSDGSHSDFAGRSKASDGSSSSSSSAAAASASALIGRDVSSHSVFLYMKGSPASPKCGFSANVVRILQHLGAAFSSRDVLEDPTVREAVKQFSDWPTLPQLYVNGEFVGGSDIITQMFKSGELEKLLVQAGVVPQQQQSAASSATAAPVTAAPAAGGADNKLAQ